ncbi:TonB-dependent receptor [Novosphingobium sp. G106]|uniref:TonB-dependent receptor n=1 Tax=Novosphingobium sp. G106 TaxID=2849500 RepID=UPI001C2D1ADD|nr:TonB-dependent receptor [Novosphingobium sp. G106]MBV1686458.1 TonB-dependent receptor [Novosphingobium sp. G106]
MNSCKDSPAAVRRMLRLSGIAGMTAVASFLASPAFAQSADEAAVDGDAIIVTAQRRNESLVNVPMSVAVVSPETLSSLGINSARELTNVTSGFQINFGGSYPQPSIRGISTTAGTFENNVALFMDGLYQTAPQVLNMDLPNVQGIQVLKGPQGTLYGRNATGGAILIDTLDPSADWTGNIEATYGRFSDRRARGYVSGPLSDRIGVSLAGTFRKTDGYYKRASRTTPGQFDGRFLGLEQEGVRAKIKAELTDTLRVTLAYNYLRASDPRGTIFTPIENTTAPFTAPGNNTRPTGLGEASGDVFSQPFWQNEGSIKLEIDTGIGTLRSVTGYSDAKSKTVYDFSGSYVPDSYGSSIIRDRTIQENVDLNIDKIKDVDLIVGGNYYNIRTNYDPKMPNSVFLGPASYRPFSYPDPATTLVPLSAYRRASDTYFFRTKNAWAIFADATVHATEQLTLNVGARYSSETQDVSGTKNVFCSDPLNPATLNCTLGTLLPGAQGTPYTVASSARTASYSKFTPRASIRYALSPGTNVYASYSKGFRSGEYNLTVPNDNPALWRDAKQESVDSFEIGLKSQGRRYHFELAGFYSDYRNLQVSFIQNIGGVPVATLANAPKAKIYGVDLNADYEIFDNFKIRAGGTWLHARYGDRFFFTGSGVNPAVAAFNTNTTDPLKKLVNMTLQQDLSGLQMARAPDFAGFVGFDYLIPKGEGGLRIAANLKYTTSYVATNPSVWGGEPLASYNARLALDPNAAPNNAALLAGTPYANRASEQRARQSAFALINASVTWTDPSDHYYVRVWGNNLTDVKYRQHYAPSSGGTYVPMAEPLTFGGNCWV